MIVLRNKYTYVFLALFFFYLGAMRTADQVAEPTQQKESTLSSAKSDQTQEDSETIELLHESEYSNAKKQKLQETKQAEEREEKDISEPSYEEEEAESADDLSAITPRRINQISVSGTKYVSKEALLNRVPYKVGEIFNPQKTRQLIRNLYYTIGRFKNINVYVEPIGSDLINVHIEVEEKKVLKDIIFEGNKQVSTKDIKSKVNLADVTTIDEYELKKFALDIQKVYYDKGYHLTKIETELRAEDDQVVAVFKIKENKKSLVKQIFFKGNKTISSKDLRNNIYTREDWILSFLDSSGIYQPERIEADKHMIEQYYQNQGFLNAKVIDITTESDPRTKHLNISFEIQEGDRYTIKEVKAPGNDILSEEFLLSQIPIRAGHFYSREGIVNTIKRLEMIWGNKGYIFAHIEPSIQPDEDEKTVTLAFYSEIGNPVRLNKINIKGNKKTRDKIIRRKINLEEGYLITNAKMEGSKNNVEGLGYFDPREGVNWKISRISHDLADLDLIVKEAKTGHFHLKFGFGGAADPSSPSSSFTVAAEIADTNLYGSGINLNLQSSWSKEQTTVEFLLANPWLFDRPIYGAMNVYHKRPTYDDFRNVQTIHEKRTGGGFTGGFIVRNQVLDDVQVLFGVGIDSLRYNGTPKAVIPNIEQAIVDEFQTILTRQFQSGDFIWLTNSIEQDHRNHPMHPSRGHKVQLFTKFALPASGKKCEQIGFFKMALDANWFTPLIGEHDLVFRLHGHVGVVTPFRNRSIPFGELYNLGGPASVRGFLFGQLGPKFLGNSIGAKKALFWNAELIFPITPDFNMKGVIFYDGGAGWDTPNAPCIKQGTLTGNSFDYRHSVGVGVRILNPMPIRIDWGFKLDPRRNRFDPSLGETASEVHFGMSYDW